MKGKADIDLFMLKGKKDWKWKVAVVILSRIFSVAGCLATPLLTESANLDWTRECIQDTNTLFLCHWNNPKDADFTSENKVEKLPSQKAAPPQYVEGKFGTGLSFGNQELRYPLTNNLNLSEGTIEFWFKPGIENWDRGDQLPHYFFFTDGCASGFVEGCFNRGTLTFLVIGIKGQMNAFYALAPTWHKDQWYHLAFCYRFNTGGKDEVRIYRDGVLLKGRGKEWKALNISTDKNPSSGYLILSASNRSCYGVMDELKISSVMKEFSPVPGSKNEMRDASRFPVDWDWQKEIAEASIFNPFQFTGKGIYVSASADAGSGDGSRERPFTTLKEALAQAHSGDKITVGAGIYREQVHIPDGNIYLGARAGEKPVIKGSVAVENWIPDKNNNYFQAQGVNLEFSYMLRPEWSLASLAPHKDSHIPEIVFCDGKPLSRCIDLDELKTKEYAFFWDRDKSNLYVRLKENEEIKKHLIEAAVKNEAFTYLEGTSNIVIDGFTVEQFASLSFDTNPEENTGAITIGTGVKNWLLKNCTINWNSVAGISIRDHCYNIVILNCTTNYNGRVGIASVSGEKIKIINCDLSYNNWRLTSPSCESAGIKTYYASRYIISGCTANYNYGPGIWFDCEGFENVISGNTMVGNTANAGIMYEVCYTGFFTDNFSAYNQDNITGAGRDSYGNGILLSSSEGNVAENNICVANQNGIVIIQVERAPGPGVGWGAGWWAFNNTISKNIIADSQDCQVYLCGTSNYKPKFDDFNNISQNNIFINAADESPKISWNGTTNLVQAQEKGYEKGSRIGSYDDINKYKNMDRLLKQFLRRYYPAIENYQFVSIQPLDKNTHSYCFRKGKNVLYAIISFENKTLHNVQFKVKNARITYSDTGKIEWFSKDNDSIRVSPHPVFIEGVAESPDGSFRDKGQSP